MSKQKDKAIAIKYDSKEDEVPKVIAMGAGEIAKKIINMANDQDIPLYQNSSLVEVLSSLEINEEIPFEVYEIIAEIIAWVHALKENNKAQIRD